MDDMSPKYEMLGDFLKDWADRYGIGGETKGGMVQLKHTKFIVTSQYSIEDTWADEETRSAIRRRFKVIHMSIPFMFERV